MNSFACIHMYDCTSKLLVYFIFSNFSFLLFVLHSMVWVWCVYALGYKLFQYFTTRANNQEKKLCLFTFFVQSLCVFFFSYLNSMCQMISISTHTFNFFYHSNSIHCIPLGCIRFKVQLQHIYHSLWSTVFTTTISIIFFSSDKHKNFTADRVRRQSLR